MRLRIVFPELPILGDELTAGMLGTPSITLDVYGEPWDDSQEQLATKLDEAIRAEMVA